MILVANYLDSWYSTVETRLHSNSLADRTSYLSTGHARLNRHCGKTKKCSRQSTHVLIEQITAVTHAIKMPCYAHFDLPKPCNAMQNPKHTFESGSRWITQADKKNVFF